MASIDHITPMRLKLGRIAALARMVFTVGGFALLYGFLGKDHPSVQIMAVVLGFAVVYNAVAVGLVLRKASPHPRELLLAERATILADATVLVISIYATGGVESSVLPVTMLLVLWLNAFTSIAFATVVVAYVTIATLSMIAMQYAGVLPFVTILKHGGEYYQNPVYVMAVAGIWVAVFPVGLFLLHYLRKQIAKRKSILEQEYQNVSDVRTLLEEVFRNVPDAVLLVRTDGKILRQNQAANDLWISNGKSNITNVATMPMFDQTGLWASIKRCFDGSKVDLMAYPVGTAGARTQYVDVHASLFPDPQNTLALIRIVDSTTQKRKEEETLEVHEELVQQQKQDAVANIASGIAHEINNPLTVVQTQIEMVMRILSQISDSDKVSDRVAAIQASVNRIARLAQDLGDYGNKQTAVASEQDVNQMMQDLSLYLKGQAEGFKADLQIEVAENIFPFNCVRGEIERMIENLVRNALQAIEQATGSNVSLKVWQQSSGDSSDLLIEVSDDGPGIDPEHAASIWEPFFTTKNNSGGTGLGLPIVVSIAERYYGKVSLDSSSKDGSIFLIRLPYDRPGLADVGDYTLPL